MEQRELPPFKPSLDNSWCLRYTLPMNKNLFALISLLFIFKATALFADNSAIGVQVGENPSIGNPGFYHSPHAALSYKPPLLPFLFGVEVQLPEWSVRSIGVTADWWMSNPRLAGMLHCYFGPGLTCAFLRPAADEEGYGLFAGVRFVFGLNMFVHNHLELFAQIAAQGGPQFFTDGAGWQASLPISVGTRVWF